MIGQGTLRSHRRAPGVGRIGSEPGLGLSRSAFVRVVRHDTGVTYELVGVVRHRPFRRSISLRTATALASSGTPLVVRRCRCAADPADPAAPADPVGSVARPPTARVR